MSGGANCLVALGRALVILIQHGLEGDGRGRARGGGVNEVGWGGGGGQYASCDVNDLSMVCLLHIAFPALRAVMERHQQHKGITKTG